MTDPKEPTTTASWRAEDLSVEWLNEALSKHDDFRGSEISSFEIDMVSEGLGFVGEVWRVKLDFQRRAAHTPDSIAAKFASRNPQTKILLTAFTVREANVYRTLGPDSESIMPRCYFSDFDLETGDCAILLEDLSEGRVDDNIGGLSGEDAETAIKAMAVFHAKWWGRTDHASTSWLPTPIDYAEFLTQVAESSAQRFFDVFGDQVDDEIREVAALSNEKLIPWLEASNSPPLTVVHGDYQRQNIFFDTQFRGSEVTVIDWQLASQAKGITDVAKMLMFGLTINDRRSMEDRLVGLYYTTLLSAGARGYNLDQCQSDYRLGILVPFTSMIVAMSNLEVTFEEDQVSVKRASAMLRDHDLLGLLRAM